MSSVPLPCLKMRFRQQTPKFCTPSPISMMSMWKILEREEKQETKILPFKFFCLNDYYSFFIIIIQTTGWLSGKMFASHAGGRVSIHGRDRPNFLKQVRSDSSTAKHSATGTSVMGPRRCLTLIYGILGYFPDLTLFWLFMYQIH